MTAPHPVHTPVVEADGALLWFDLRELLTSPDAAVRIEVTDPVAAQRWLARVAGPHRTRTAIVDGSVELAAPPELTRLALLLWARRWWPAGALTEVRPLDAALLALETAVATIAVDELSDGMLDGFEATPAELFDTAVTAGPVPVHARGLCAELARWFDEQDDLDRAEQARRIVAALAVPAPTQRGYALVAGTGSTAPGVGVLASGTASVDWALVPPGVLDAAEDTVEWRVVAAVGGTRLDVEVLGALRAARLTAALTEAGRELTSVALTRVDERFAGTRDLDGPLVQAIAAARDLDVHVTATGVRPAEPGPRTTAADRAAVTALVRSRASLPDASRTLAELAAAEGTDEF